MENNKAQKNGIEEKDFGADFDYLEKNTSNDLYNQKSEKKISPRTLFGVLLFLGLGTLVLGFASLRKNIYSPNQVAGNSSSQVEETDVIDQLLTLQNIDTDNDGITDYDEEYIHGTSPYLPDTDSDGYLDKEEIDSGHDPLCPAGTDCRGMNEGGGSGEELEIFEDEELTQPLPDEVVQELNNLTADEVRQLLLESGYMTEEQLNLIDDESLMTMFREVLNNSAQ